MSRKVFVAIVAVFAAAIAVTFVAYTGLLTSLERNLRAIMLVKTTDPDYEFWQLVSQGAEAGAGEYGVTLNIVAPADEEDLGAQLALADWAIGEKPDFIILAPQDRGDFPDVCERVKDAGIQLILMDSTIDQDTGAHTEDCFVGIRNEEAAAHLSAEMAMKLHGRGKVAILTHGLESSTANDRVAGISDYLSGWPEMDIVEIDVCGDSAQQSYQDTLRLLDEYPDLAGIIATNQMCTQGASEALQEHPERDIAFYAFDTAPSQNAALEAGIADGFIVQLAFNMGYLSVQAGWQSCTGQLRTQLIDSGYVYATRDNMREDDIEKLIYPFV